MAPTASVSPKALLFSDIVDSTALVQRLGDAEASALWARHDHLLAALLERHDGREIDRSDGSLLLFDAVPAAAAFAIDYHATLDGLGLRARVGLHCGPVSLRAAAPEAVARGAKPVEVDGLAKPLAARVMALAGAGRTLLSAEAAAALAPVLAPGLTLHALGHYRLKGIVEPVALFGLGPAGQAIEPPADAEKAYRVVRDGAWWKPVREVRHNLAPERDAFVGRSAELRALAARFDAGGRLVSITGIGGTGKTRLARRYARAWLGDWPGGVAFCDLSEATTPAGICFAVAAALEVPLGDDDPVARLGHAIAGRARCLLVLDNVEQVVAPARDMIGRWLDRAPEARWLLTTRERLQLAGESVLELGPLATATGDDGRDDEREDAIDLFILRARAQRTGFEPDAAARAQVREIVRLLDGLPLAIELAAARTRVLTLPQIAQRLGDRFALLGAARAAGGRQATLRATIDWSWDLLAPPEQAALAQCALFEGGFALDAAESVIDLSAWPDAPPVLDVIDALAHKSLLNVTSQGETDAEPWFGLYLTVREYAARRLDGMGADAADAARHRHGLHYAACGSETAIEALFRSGGAARRDRLVRDIDNLVAACRRATAQGRADIAVPCFLAAWQVLDQRGPASVATALVAPLADLPMDDALADRLRLVRFDLARRASGVDASFALAEATAASAARRGDLRNAGRAHVRLASTCIRRRDLEGALRHAQTALDTFRRDGAEWLEVGALEIGAHAASAAGDPPLAQERYERALEICRRIGHEVGEAQVLGSFAAWLLTHGHARDGRRMLEQAVEARRALRLHRSLALDLTNLANLDFEEGRFDDADRRFAEALSTARHTGDRWQEALALSGMAESLRIRGRLDEAMEAALLALPIQRELKDPVATGNTLAEMGEIGRLQGHPARAQAWLEEALTLLTAGRSPRSTGIALGSLAALQFDRGDLAGARARIAEADAALEAARDLLELGRLACLRGFVELAGGDREAAAAALARARAMAEATGVPPGSRVPREIERLAAALGGSATG